MKKKFLLYTLFSFLIISCTYKKGDLPVPVTSLPCVNDTIIHTKSITIGDNFFSPVIDTILQGDTLKWTYPTGVSAHTATCDGTGGTTLPSGGNTWDSGILSAGQSYKKAISVAGTYTYICTIHGLSMSGTIIVKTRCH